MISARDAEPTQRRQPAGGLVPRAALGPDYCGRFAPSPTGPLHFGSLVAAVGSYLQARRAGGRWLVRIEDLDPPRTQPGAADRILRALERFGLEWDGEVVYQSRRQGRYREVVGELQRRDLAYPCGCSRRDLVLRDGHRVYPGTCRTGLAAGAEPRSIRLRCDGARVSFEDAVHGRIEQDLEQTQGDIVVRRADGLFAYHLAVVVDDADQGVTQVVRGGDLLASTPSQIHLQRVLGLPSPRYMHLPLVVDRHGDKLSKQTKAAPVETAQAVSLLVASLRFLGQRPPADLGDSGLAAVLAWGVKHWRPERVTPGRGYVALPLPSGVPDAGAGVSSTSSSKQVARDPKDIHAGL